MGMGWKVDAEVVSVYQTKNGSLSPRLSKTQVIRGGLALGVADRSSEANPPHH